jgi:hypothetical protein
VVVEIVKPLTVYIYCYSALLGVIGVSFKEPFPSKKTA